MTKRDQMQMFVLKVFAWAMVVAAVIGLVQKI
jgi:hypothetical protein